jgi:hypothetical protein
MSWKYLTGRNSPSFGAHHYPQVFLLGGTAFPGCAGKPVCTGWKACATESEFLVFSTRFCFKPVDLPKELVHFLVAA